MDNIKILLISSDPGTAEWARNIFTKIPGTPYELSIYDTYHQGINAMLKSHFQLYLVEHEPAGFDGLQILHEAVRSNCLEPVIILSRTNDRITDREALTLGAADYLPMEGLCPLLLEKTLRYSLKQAKAFELLKESENRYRTLFERSIDPIIITDSQGLIYDINPAGLRALGASYEEVIHTNCSRFYSNVKDRERLIEVLEECGMVSDFEVRAVSVNGSMKCFNITAFVQISQHGDKELYHTIFRDITPVKKAVPAYHAALQTAKQVLGYPDAHS